MNKNNALLFGKYLTALNDEISSKIIKAGYNSAFWNQQLTVLINSILINSYDKLLITRCTVKTMVQELPRKHTISNIYNL